MVKDDRLKVAVVLAVLFVVAILSFTVAANWVQKPEIHKKQFATLDEKKETVLKLTAVTTATSTLITVLPGDMATPIAEKLADVSGYLVIVLCAIFLEKYLLVITWVAVFKIIIPLICILIGVRLFVNKEVLNQVILKLALFGVAICLVIPASVGIANLIEHTYENSIQEAIDGGIEVSQEFRDELGEEDTAKEDEEESILDKITGWTKGITEKVQDTVSTFSKENIQKMLKSSQKEINNLIEAVAVMLVTSCLIPVLVLIFMLWLVKTLLNVDIEKIGKKRL
ncbi:MAG: hypothetical protein E7280_03445 [Lachnospiraceae bacterium]|jgi:hypothetical protein|nr:hypothetical protein [Lachnospiraceae bacterium]